MKLRLKNQFPSPLPSPTGRGRIVGSQSPNRPLCQTSLGQTAPTEPIALNLSLTTLSCALSPGERVGVRGISNAFAINILAGFSRGLALRLSPFGLLSAIGFQPSDL